MVHIHHVPGLQRSLHTCCSGRLHTYDLALRPDLLDIGAQPGSQTASADGNEHEIRSVLGLMFYFISYSALTFNDFLVIKRRDEGLSAACRIFLCCFIGLVESVSGKHYVHILFSEHIHRFDFLSGSRDGHIYGTQNLQLVARECHSLGVVPC